MFGVSERRRDQCPLLEDLHGSVYYLLLQAFAKLHALTIVAPAVTGE